MHRDLTYAALLFICCTLILACDTLNTSRIIVSGSAQPTRGDSTYESVVEEVETILAEHEFKRIKDEIGAWFWPGDDNPGILVEIFQEDGELSVSIAQGLYGPIGPIEEFKAARDEILDRLKQDFGTKVTVSR